MKNSKKGYTLLELIVVIAIIVLLAGVGIYGVVDSIQDYKAQAAIVADHNMGFEGEASGQINDYKADNIPGVNTATPTPISTPTPTPEPTSTPIPRGDNGNNGNNGDIVIHGDNNNGDNNGGNNGGDNGGYVSPTPSPTPRVQATNTSSGSTSLGGGRYGGNMSISGNGQMIYSVTITFNYDVSLNNVNADYRYTKSPNGNSITLTYNEGNMPYNQPITNLNISNITWGDDTSASSIIAAYSVTYCQVVQ